MSAIPIFKRVKNLAVGLSYRNKGKSYLIISIFNIV